MKRTILVRRPVFSMAMAAALALAPAACGHDDAKSQTPSANVSIEMTDFAYKVSGRLVAGGTLRVSNVGKEFHVLGMGRLKPGKTVAGFVNALRRMGEGGGGGGGGPGATDPSTEFIDDVGPPAGILFPGQSVELTVPDLRPGKYALVCYIPSEGEGRPHFTKGMFGDLEVVAGAAPAPPQADVVYRIASGQPVQGPTALKPGRHTIKFEVAPGSERLGPAIVKLATGMTYGDVDKYLKAFFESHPPSQGAAATAPGQIVYGAVSFLDTTSFFVTVDLATGDYAIAATEADAVNAPQPPTELINVKVA